MTSHYLPHSAQATSPITLPSAHFPPLAQGGERVSRAPYRSRPLGLRTEEYYDDAAGEYSAHLEVPGVRRSDLSITLAKNVHTRVQEIVIQGQRQDPTAEGKQTRICSRLVYGRFREVLPVGNEVKVRRACFVNPVLGDATAAGRGYRCKTGEWNLDDHRTCWTSNHAAGAAEHLNPLRTRCVVCSLECGLE